MKTTLVRFAIAASAASLTACGMMSGTQDNPKENPQGYRRYLQDPSTTQPAPPDTTDPTVVPPGPGDSTTPPQPPPTKTPDTTITDPGPATPPPPAPPQPTSQYPYGKPVPGKKGFVTSPYDDKAGMIDVRDYAPGTKVRDPYTNKIFLVP